jgi:hypothetical protein
MAILVQVAFDGNVFRSEAEERAWLEAKRIPYVYLISYEGFNGANWNLYNVDTPDAQRVLEAYYEKTPGYTDMEEFSGGGVHLYII